MTSDAIKKRSSHLICKVANKCLKVHEWVEVVERNKDGPSIPLLSRESSALIETLLEKNDTYSYGLWDHHFGPKFNGHEIRLLDTNNLWNFETA